MTSAAELAFKGEESERERKEVHMGLSHTAAAHKSGYVERSISADIEPQWRKLTRLAAHILTAIVMLAADTALATTISGPVVNPSNRHVYYLLSQNTWSGSESDAQDLGGHLVTVRSQAEEDWIASTFSEYAGIARGLWIGFYDPTQDSSGGSHADNFVWVSGEPVSYTAWAPGEPNNSGGQYNAYMYPPGAGPAAGRWDDAAGASTVFGYGGFLSFGLYGVAEVVPESDSILMMGIGLIAVSLLKRLGRSAAAA
jgi:hypothetical protein